MESALQAEVQGKVMEIRREGTPALCPWDVCARLMGWYRTGVKRQNKLEVATVKYAKQKVCLPKLCDFKIFIFAHIDILR